MFRKYEKTYRLSIPGFEVPGKFSLSDREVSELLSGKVIVEEKMDGANTGIIRFAESYRLQKRGSLVDTSEHEQFNRFKAWASEHYNNIMSIPPGYVVYGEFLYAQHHIFYDRLPDWFLVFDIFSISRRQYVNYEIRRAMCESAGLWMVPLIGVGHYTKEELGCVLLPKVSRYGDRAEGIVIKRYSKKKYLRTKLVWPDFVKEVDESDHWTKYNIRTNRVIHYDY